ncbi:tagatose bisphosphate family class II aldolase [Clostridium sediminicola]|uniref:class II fructose-bisphosphate aldolase n=1 Tax=Clostridium sediminicola TaxID=3114879 RepID=UPI0031F1EC67
MALYTVKELLSKIPKESKCAVGAFNVHNMEYTQGVIRGIEEENAPAILMIGSGMIHYFGLEMLTTICLEAAKKSTAPVAVLLDHGRDMEHIDTAIEMGLSIMFDGSHLPYEENVRLTREVVEKAHAKGLSVEGEIGSLSGVEDGVSGSENMTDPDQAVDFIERTGIDVLAISIGNSHGLYTGPQKIDVERLKAIKAKVDIPIVFHGGSDLEESLTKEVISEGISKFNIATDLKIVFSRTLRDTLTNDLEAYNPPDVFNNAKDAVCQLTREKIQLFGTSGKAELYK